MCLCLFDSLAAMIVPAIILPLLLPLIPLAMVLSPPLKKRKRDRKSSPNEKTATAGATTEQLLGEADSGFSQDFLEEDWANSLANPKITNRERILAAINYWKQIQALTPSTAITNHAHCRQKFMFSRTEAAVKRGLLSQIIYICVYGHLAKFPRDTTFGGLLKGSSGAPQYTNIIVPLVNFICSYFNVKDRKGRDLFTAEDVLDENYGHWRKNMILRSTEHGVWSDTAVEEHLHGLDEEDPLADETCCKGVYYEWYKVIVSLDSDFHKETMKAKPTHFLTDDQNEATSWAAVKDGVGFV